MALLIRELQRSAKGSGANDEDWWRLVFDTDTKRLYVEHEWQHTEVREAGHSGQGKERVEIPDYLTQAGQTAGHRELWLLIQTLFREAH
ncbi:hypothetical protein [Methylobacterium soli]|uniref:Uncharacterized protein n=1 Tax=Methylobacterium soli TaxID=553447 RepID=A0A6L3SST9_9HYPH|nr:hypothetical protein [Methylobacterium soli]KAB1072368.1 hypothetical protein F6X53_28170 [Methylobacterium soli]GJE46861.1 hypothetical protein AEGHOMDF_6070 [Methylobacterium soli]